MTDRRAIGTILAAATLLLGLPTSLQGAPTCTITGTPSSDDLPGTPGPDVICGQGGDDVIRGFDGDDILYGGPGGDTIDGGLGTDIVLGEEGVDVLSGGDGDDYLDGGVDGAAIDGGDGPDACLRGTVSSCYGVGIDDDNDTAGRSDVRRVRSHADQDPPWWKIKTFAAWTVRGIWDAGYLVLFVDTLDDAAPDYHVLMYSNGKKMHGGLYRETASGGEVRIGPALVSKSGKRGVIVRLPLDELNRTRPYFRWNVVTLFTGKGCHKVCFDRVPGPAMLPQGVPAEL